MTDDTPQSETPDDESVIIQGHTLRGLSDAMSRAGDGLVAELEPWSRSREAAIDTVGKIPVLVMDVETGGIFSIVEVKTLLVEGRRYVVFGAAAQ